MLVASLDWSMILSSLILASPGVVAAYFAGVNFSRLRTPSRRPIGHLVEESHTLTAGRISEQLDELDAARRNGEGGN